MWQWYESLTPELVWGLYTRGLGLVYVISYASLVGQVVHTSGRHGGFPAHLRLAKMRRDFPLWRRWLHFPTLLWLNDSDLMLRALTWVGLIAGAVVIYGGPYSPYALAVCYVCYVSLDLMVGLIYPWDCLLFEASVLGLFLPGTHALPELTRVGGAAAGAGLGAPAAAVPADVRLRQAEVPRQRPPRISPICAGFLIGQPLPSPARLVRAEATAPAAQGRRAVHVLRRDPGAVLRARPRHPEHHLRGHDRDADGRNPDHRQLRLLQHRDDRAVHSAVRRSHAGTARSARAVQPGRAGDHQCLRADPHAVRLPRVSVQQLVRPVLAPVGALVPDAAPLAASARLRASAASDPLAAPLRRVSAEHRAGDQGQPADRGQLGHADLARGRVQIRLQQRQVEAQLPRALPPARRPGGHLRDVRARADEPRGADDGRVRSVFLRHASRGARAHPADRRGARHRLPEGGAARRRGAAAARGADEHDHARAGQPRASPQDRRVLEAHVHRAAHPAARARPGAVGRVPARARALALRRDHVAPPQPAQAPDRRLARGQGGPDAARTRRERRRA